MIDIIGSIRHIYRRVNQLFDFSSATLQLTETGGTLMADGTEQNLVIVDTPLGTFSPLKIKVDMSAMDWGDSTTIKWYERLADGGGYVEKDEKDFNGPQNILPDSPVKNVELEPNRFGIQVTLQQTAGTLRAYPWEYLAEA